jgi:hypothetical protein
LRSDWPTRGESAGLPQRGLDLRPAAGWPAVRDEPCRTISDSPPLELLLRLGHAAVGGPRRSRCRHARCQSAGARWCRSAPAASATPTRVALHLDRLGRRCHGALACSGPGTVSLAHSGSILISPGPFRRRRCGFPFFALGATGDRRQPDKRTGSTADSTETSTSRHALPSVTRSNRTLKV